MKSIFLTLFLSICFSGIAQLDNFQKEIIDLLNINGTREYYSADYYEVFPLLQRNFKDRNIPEEAWTHLKEGEDEQLDKLVSMLAFAYRKHYTQEDIAKMTEFYTTETAQKFLADKDLTSDEQKEIDDFLDSDIGKKMKKKQKDLQKDLRAIKDDWSRELFGAKMKQLIKEGYL